MRGDYTIGLDEATGLSYMAVGFKWRDREGKLWGLCRRFRESVDAYRYLDFMNVWFGGQP